MVLVFRYIFAVQITMQRKVEFKKKFYTVVTKLKVKRLLKQKTNSETENKKFITSKNSKP